MSSTAPRPAQVRTSSAFAPRPMMRAAVLCTRFLEAIAIPADATAETAAA